jgi:prolyl-tRNA editing enzyme YbaK/EbsC (Cys-tRNA(Pro) deacylase)
VSPPRARSNAPNENVERSTFSVRTYRRTASWPKQNGSVIADAARSRRPRLSAPSQFDNEPLRPEDGAVEVRTRLDAALSTLGVPFELFPCDPALADTAQFCAAYGFALEDSANTIIVVGKSDPRRYAACVVLAPHRLDVNRTVRDRLGTRKASFASADETRVVSGMEIGGVTPFGLPSSLPVWVDGAVMTRDRIVLGGGSRSWKVIAAPSILLALPNVEVVDGLAGPAPH